MHEKCKIEVMEYLIKHGAQIDKQAKYVSDQT